MAVVIRVSMQDANVPRLASISSGDSFSTSVSGSDGVSSRAGVPIASSLGELRG
jgi:hypothetical protein